MQTKDMSAEQLRTKGNEYRMGMLEGGEGYNPYAAELDRRADLVEAARPRSAADVLRDLAALDCAIARESGTYDQARIDALRAELATLTTPAPAPATTWTIETTLARRAEWNGWLQAQGSKKISVSRIIAREREVGWSLGDLRAAVAAHGIK